MELILKEDVRSLGRAGDVVKVKSGYARNFLLPQKKALLADETNRKVVEELKKKQSMRLAKEKEEAAELADKISRLNITVTKQAGDDEDGKSTKLFGSVTTMEIAQALAKEGLAVDKKLLHLDKPIKELGSFKVAVKLHPEVVATLKIKVAKQ
jgi:large subunit ribosomal protein L9